MPRAPDALGDAAGGSAGVAVTGCQPRTLNVNGQREVETGAGARAGKHVLLHAACQSNCNGERGSLRNEWSNSDPLRDRDQVVSPSRPRDGKENASMLRRCTAVRRASAPLETRSEVIRLIRPIRVRWCSCSLAATASRIFSGSTSENRYIQNVHFPVAITYSESARFVTACTSIRSPSERVRRIHQL